MAKKGRKAALQKSAKAIYAQKAGKHDRGRSRPGRPDGGVSAIANSLKKKTMKPPNKSSKPASVAGPPSGESLRSGLATSHHEGGSKVTSIPFSTEDIILLIGDGRMHLGLHEPCR